MTTKTERIIGALLVLIGAPLVAAGLLWLVIKLVCWLAKWVRL